eukprot:COSAG01_NODE_43495_length_429_cov_0.924242_1_plen_57_part_01
MSRGDGAQQRKHWHGCDRERAGLRSTEHVSGGGRALQRHRDLGGGMGGLAACWTACG